MKMKVTYKTIIICCWVCKTYIHPGYITCSRVNLDLLCLPLFNNDSFTHCNGRLLVLILCLTVYSEVSFIVKVSSLSKGRKIDTRVS